MLRLSAVCVALRSTLPAAAIVAALAVPAGSAGAAQDKYTVKAANGVSFAEFKGYETWSDVAVSQVDGGLKAILANPAMIAAYRSGVPGNGKPFPEGSKIVKIEWAPKKNPQSPYAVNVPDTLKSVSFIEKDSKRFTKSNGWGYAQFLYDPASATFKPSTTDPTFNEKLCHACHVAVKANDYIFTAYPKR